MEGENRTKVLLVESDPSDARAIQERLASANEMPCEVECVETLSKALARLGHGGVDIVLLDLSLPDSEGLRTFAEVQAEAPEVPIIVLIRPEEEAVALEAIRNGAQDGLIKGQTDCNLLVRSLRYAMGRHQVQEELRTLSLADGLTGLTNRRGFLLLAEQHLKLANRTKQPFVLLIADVDNLKKTNDTRGHLEGDLALMEIAMVLTKTFRGSDIVARLGGDEFAALAIDVKGADAEVLAARLQEELKLHNEGRDRRYPLSLSVGAASYDPNNPCSLEDLLARADAELYQQKRAAGTARGR